MRVHIHRIENNKGDNGEGLLLPHGISNRSGLWGVRSREWDQRVGYGEWDRGNGTKGVGYGEWDRGNGIERVGYGEWDRGNGIREVGSGKKDEGSGTREWDQGSGIRGNGIRIVGSR